MTDLNASRFSELYSAYAAGRLDPGFALLVETQGALRADVREAVAASEAIAGVFLEAGPGADMPAGAADRALALIDALEAAEPDTPALAPEALPEMAEMDALPEPLHSAALAAAGATGWTAISPGVRRLALAVGSAVDVELYRFAPGALVREHTHAAQEYTLVVSGGYSDAMGSYGPGDLAVKGPEDTHRPVGDPGEPCYALIVRDGALRLTGMMGVVQRLLGK